MLRRLGAVRPRLLRRHELGDALRCRQRGGRMATNALVERVEVAHQHADRPAVADGMVHPEQQLVVGGGVPHQHGAEQRTIGEIGDGFDR